MELKEMQTLPIAPAVGVPFASSWSDDNKISVLTEKGLYIVEVVPDPDNTSQGFELFRNWIEPDDFFPTSRTGINCDDLVWKLNQREAYEVVLDTYLAPDLANTKSVHPYVTQTAWSPAGMLFHDRCLLAAVTNYGSVVVQAPQGKQWSTIVNISSLWTDRCTAEWAYSDETIVPKDQYDLLQARTSKLRTTAITWSSLMGSIEQSFSLLVMGLLNGTLLFWRLNGVTSTRDTEQQPNLILQIETLLYRITAMHWAAKTQNSGLLCVGDVTGFVKMFTLKWEGEEFFNVSSVDLWPHKDRIPVSRLLTMPSEDSGDTVIVVKGSFVIAIALDNVGNICASHPHLVGNLSISGIVPLDNKCLLVVTHNGSFHKLTVVRSDSKLNIITQSLNSVIVPKSAYYGLSASINRAIFCFVTCFSTTFDHLIQREPAQLTFFKLCGLPHSYQVLLSNPSRSLAKYWDHMEMMRLQGPPFPDVEQGQLEELSTYHLKIQMWLCNFALLQEEVPEKCVILKENLKQAEQLVLIHHVYERITKLKSQSSLSDDDKQSLSLMLTWLRQKKSNMGSSAIPDDILNYAESFKDLPENEKCAMCEGKCEEINRPSESMCVAGHKLSRCCVTMLQCAHVPLWMCQVCHSIAHPSAAERGKAPICVYCDSVLQLDDRLLLEGEDDDDDDDVDNCEKDESGKEITKKTDAEVEVKENGKEAYNVKKE